MRFNHGKSGGRRRSDFTPSGRRQSRDSNKRAWTLSLSFVLCLLLWVTINSCTRWSLVSSFVIIVVIAFAITTIRVLWP